MSDSHLRTVAVVVPAFRARHTIDAVLESMPALVTRIFVVDDGCPESTGLHVQATSKDSRVLVLMNETNGGVGAAMKLGYSAALAEGIDIIVKVDADGQMDPNCIADLIAPLNRGLADYTKGNRFFDMDHVRGMPPVRLLGNALLSFMTKFSTGYWDIFDPNNGFTAITREALTRIPLNRVSNRYFFESDMLFRLGIARAVVADVPIPARYNGELSSLRIGRIAGEFAYKHTINTLKRIVYGYYVRDMSLASIELPIGALLILSGGTYGAFKWVQTTHTGDVTPPGTVMLAALPVLLGTQLILAFVAHDIASTPRRPLTSW